MLSSAFGRLAVLVGLGAMIGTGAALAQTLIIRAPVSGGGAAVSGPQNGQPALTGNPGDHSHPQGTPYSVTLTATDPEGEAVTVTATTLPGWLSDGAGLAQGGSVTLANGASLTLSGTPVPGAGDQGDHPVSLALVDEQGLAGTSVDFTITITPPAATIDLANVNRFVMIDGATQWSGTLTIAPTEAALGLILTFDDGSGTGAMAVIPGGDAGNLGFLENNETWIADRGGLELTRSAGTITLSGSAAAGQYSLELTPEYAPSATPLTLTALDQTKLTADDGAAFDDVFGYAVALDGNTALIGAYGNDDGGNDSGRAYVFTRSGTVWAQQAKLTAGVPLAGDKFGYTVALDGDTALIGANGDDDGGPDSGSAYVFTRSFVDGIWTWTQQAKLTASDAEAGDEFGYSVALSGNTALIGAYRNDDAGSAYIFEIGSCNGGNFGFDDGCRQIQKLTAGDDAAAGDSFGDAVALAGNTALVGAHGNDDDDGGSNSGSAYVFTWDGTVWTQQQKLTASDPVAYHLFGRAVALAGDTALIGAHGDDDGGSDSGSAYVFTRSGGSWSQQAKLSAGDAAAGDFFGIAVALDGDTALIGAHYGDGGAAMDSGSAYITDLTPLP